MDASVGRDRFAAERGSVLIAMALWLIALMAVAALAIDIGLMYSHRQQLQNIADAGALAGAEALRQGMNPAAAVAAVKETVNANSTVGESVIVSDNDIVVGAWNDVTKTVDPWDPTKTDPAVQVTANRTKGSASGPEPTILAGILGRKTVDVSATAIAGVFPTNSHRDPVELMIVQDASSSFQGAWSKAVGANGKLVNIVNGISVQNDATGFVAFNAALSQSYLRSSGLDSSYAPYPQMNQGLKYTTTTSGTPRLVDPYGTGAKAPTGQVRQMASPPVKYDTNHVLPTALQQLYGTNSSNTDGLIYRGNAWGDTDTGAGLQYAIDQWYNTNGSLRPGVSAATRKVIVVVSDGMPHSVDGTSATNALKAKAVAQATRGGGPLGGPGKGLGIVIHTVTLEGSGGANYAFNESLVRNGGYAFRAADANALADVMGIAVPGQIFGKPHLLK
jgi:hypothetical protein